jgi:hypothetical protein
MKALVPLVVNTDGRPESDMLVAAAALITVAGWIAFFGWIAILVFF